MESNRKMEIRMSKWYFYFVIPVPSYDFLITLTINRSACNVDIFEQLKQQLIKDLL